MSGLIQSSKEKQKDKKQRTRGLVQNKPIEFTATTEITELTDSAQNKEKKSSSKKKGQPGSNQQVTIKIPGSVKQDLNTLMTITGNKFIYEMIDATMQYYIDNKLNPDEKKIFKFMSKQS